MRKTTIPGLAPKPDFCLNNCPRGISTGIGFVPDWCPTNPKMAILINKPTKGEAVSRQPFTSGYMRFFFATVGKELGLTKHDIMVSYVLRCNSYEWPTGRTRKLAEATCRHWDDRSGDTSGLPTTERGLISWNPNVFIPTFGFDDAVELDAFQALFVEDFRKGMRWVASGYRPLMLCGKESMELVAPWLRGRGGIKKWRGHWWEGYWPFTGQIENVTYDKKVENFADQDKKCGGENQPPPEQTAFTF